MTDIKIKGQNLRQFYYWVYSLKIPIFASCYTNVLSCLAVGITAWHCIFSETKKFHHVLYKRRITRVLCICTSKSRSQSATVDLFCNAVHKLYLLGACFDKCSWLLELTLTMRSIFLILFKNRHIATALRSVQTSFIALEHCQRLVWG